MGYGTGVLRAYYMWYLIRGLTTGVAGAGSLFIARNTGIQQHILIASRGVGLALGPVVLGKSLGWAAWSGNAELGFSLALSVKMASQLLIPRLMSHTLLCLCFFWCGVAMSVLDCLGGILVTRIHGGDCAGIFARYDTIYSMGCMVAPFIVVTLHDSSWDFLSVVDLLTVAVVVRKRVLRGKPRDWKVKIRGGVVPGPVASCDARLATSPDTADSEGNSPTYPATAPVTARVERPSPAPRVVRAGLAFALASQLGMTAVSAWGFTYGAKTMRLPEKVAALIPGAFYTGNMLSRCLLVAVSSRHLPSTLLHCGTMGTVVGAVCIAALASQATAILELGAESLDTALTVPMLLVAFGVLGGSYSGCYSLTIAAMQQQGDLNSQEHGWYGTAACLGITLGMWLPGVYSLPKVEVGAALAMLMILTASERDFPRRRKALAERKADAVVGT